MSDAIEEREQTIQVIVVREKNGKRVRCLYIGHVRVWGSKPYVSENLPHEFFDVPMLEVYAALRFERDHSKTKGVQP